MKKLIGPKKIRTAVFISGTGSNLKNLIRFSKTKQSLISIDLIVSNTSKAIGLKYSQKYNIKKKIFNFKKSHSHENYILSFLKKNDIVFICLAGFMKILSNNFIKKFDGKIINIHPSLLPKYKGLNTHERAIRNKDKYSGCTVHYVTDKLDSGRMIMQTKVRISSQDNAASLAKKILKKEHKLYPAAILKIIN
jgi:phosphoribosylglycinamide formyltransferase 1